MRFVSLDIINKHIHKRKFPVGFFLLIFLLLVILFTFWGLFSTFYQQDEWLVLGQIKELGKSYITYGFSNLQILFGEGRPLTRLLSYFYFNSYPFNFIFLALYSLGFHFANSLIVYFICKRLFRDRFYSFIAASFFAFNSVSHQAVSWFGAAFGIQPAALLTLLSILFLFKYMEFRRNRFLILSYICAFVSLYFKEIGIFLFVLLPIIPIILGKKVKLKENIKLYIPIAICAVVFALYRIYLLLFVRGQTSGILSGSNFLVPHSGSFLYVLAMRFFVYPISSFSLVLFSPSLARGVALFILKTSYPYIIVQGETIAYTVILEMLSIIVTIILVFLLFRITEKDKEGRKIILFALTFFSLSILPYIVISKQYAYLEPRYYYISIAAAAIIFAFVFKYLFTKCKENIALKGLLVLVIFIFYTSHITTIRQDIKVQEGFATKRISYIEQLKKLVPQLKNNDNIFYVTGDRPWLTDGNFTPFQNGLGYTLMVLYYDSGRIPKGLLSSGYLFNLNAQGHRKTGVYGFGYYYSKKDLLSLVHNKSLNINDVIGLYYNSESGKLYSISGQIQRELREE